MYNKFTIRIPLGTKLLYGLIIICCAIVTAFDYGSIYMHLLAIGIILASSSFIVLRNLRTQHKLVDYLWAFAIVFQVLNVRTFTVNSIMYLLCLVIGCGILFTNKKNYWDLLVSHKIFLYTGLIFGITNFIELVAPNLILRVIGAISSGALQEARVFLANGRYLGIANYTWSTILFMIVGVAVVYSQPSTNTWYKALCSFILFGAVILGGSRSSIFIFPICLALAFGGKNTKKWILGILLVFVLMVVLSQTINFFSTNSSFRLFYKLQQMIERLAANETVDSQRTWLRSLAYTVYQENKLLGIGTYQFCQLTYGITRKYFHVHNLYYQLLAEQGIIGTVLIAIPSIYTYFKLILIMFQNRCFTRDDSSRRIQAARYAFMILTYIYISSFVHVTVFKNTTLIIYFITNTIALGVIYGKEKNE